MLKDEAMILTDDERRMIVVALGIYESNVREEINQSGMTEGLEKMLNIKKVLNDKMWGR